MNQDHEAEVSRRGEPIRPRNAAKPDKAGTKAQKQIDPERLNKAIRYLKGHPNQQTNSRLSPPHLIPGDRRYFNAELLQVAHRIPCPTPKRNSTATKTIDRLSTLTRSFAGRSNCFRKQYQSRSARNGGSKARRPNRSTQSPYECNCVS